MACAQFHQLLFGGSRLRNGVSAFKPIGCPFIATKAFLGKQAFSLFQNSLHVPIIYELGTTLNPCRINSESGFCKMMRLHSTTSAEINPSQALTSQTMTPQLENKPISPEGLEILVIGLSHHNAGVEIREKLSIPEAQWNSASNELCRSGTIKEATIISTCNRFEIYIAGENPYECIHETLNYLTQRTGATLDRVFLRRYLFMLTGEDAMWHLLRVTAGLDSIVVGEGQILSQVKRSYESCLEKNGNGGKIISRLFNCAITAGKRARAETGIARGAVSISSAAVEFSSLMLSQDCGIQGGLKNAKIVLLGAGKMARLLLVHLQSQDVREVVVLNRSPERVLALKEEFPDIQIDYKPLDQLWEVVKEADVVFPSTNSTTTLIDPDPLSAALQTRTSPFKGIQFIDLSVPRNVHPACSSVDGVHSYNVDHLKSVVDRNNAKRRHEMLQAESILREEMGKFTLWRQSLGTVPLIARLQEKAENIRQEEMSKMSKKLSALTPKDLDLLDRLTKGIVSKLLHGPMTHLKQQKGVGETRLAINQIQQAFQLEPQAA